MGQRGPPLAAKSEVAVRRLTAPGMHAVGGVPGLYLRISAAGNRSWILRASVAGQRRDIGLGRYPDVGLAQARTRGRELRDQIWRGIDPVAERRVARELLRAAREQSLSFAAASRRWYQTMAPQWSDNPRAGNALARLERHAFAAIGSVPVGEVTIAQVLSVLEPLWHTKTESAKKLRYAMEGVFDWAISAGHRTASNPAAWKGALKSVLPAPGRIARVSHHPALHWREVAGFLTDLRHKRGMAVLALEFAILTACRSGEVRHARWAEIDLERRLWAIPAARMKSRRDHVVPLSDAAIRVLRLVPRSAGTDIVFHNRNGRPLSDVMLSVVCRRMGVAAVPHGFRSSFKEWARACSRMPDEVSELCLAHVSSDATRAAYARDSLLPQRTRLMVAWGEFCTRPSMPGVVVGIGR